MSSLHVLYAKTIKKIATINNAVLAFFDKCDGEQSSVANYLQLLNGNHMREHALSIYTVCSAGWFGGMTPAGVNAPGLCVCSKLAIAYSEIHRAVAPLAAADSSGSFSSVWSAVALLIHLTAFQPCCFQVWENVQL